MIIILKEYPELHTAIKKALPRYKKQKAILVFADSVTPNDTCWDGGSRSGYAVYNLDGSFISGIDAPSAPVQFGGSSPKPHTIAPNTMVLKTGTFRGKPATVFVYLPKSSVIN
jgi:hypothetical protein